MGLRIHRLAGPCIAFVLLLSVLPTSAAYISEIDLGGPAGQAVELSAFDASLDHTLIVMDANPYNAGAFGNVLEVVHVQPNTLPHATVMISDTGWPGDVGLTTTLSSLSPASGNTQWNLSLPRLLIVMVGEIDVRLGDQPLSDPASQSRYNDLALTDWLVVGSGDLAPLYQTRGHDISNINQTLGIRLLDRIVDSNDGRVVGRTRRSGEAVDMDTFFVGDPDTSRAFEVDDDLDYIYTPGQPNLPLLETVPEPGTVCLLLAGAALCLRRLDRASR